MDLSEIEFLPELSEEKHPRFAQLRSHIVANAREFAAYHQVFERLVAERFIMIGRRVTLMTLPVTRDATATLFEHLIGVNQHAIDRVRMIGELLTAYDADPESEFFRDTAYHRYLTEFFSNGRRTLEQVSTSANDKIAATISIYRNMRAANGLVANARDEEAEPTWRYYDLPWDIDYFGVRRMRDGAHRRAIAAHLGIATLPALVFSVSDINEGDLEDSSDYVRLNFPWYRALLAAAHASMHGIRA